MPLSESEIDNARGLTFTDRDMLETIQGFLKWALAGGVLDSVSYVDLERAANDYVSDGSQRRWK